MMRRHSIVLREGALHTLCPASLSRRRQIFAHHARALDYDAHHSGCEWWPQVCPLRLTAQPTALHPSAQPMQ
jgi:hypothetical protein